MEILSLLVLFTVKHWIIDFVWQTSLEVQHKGTYLDWRGITHSVKHGVGTAVILWVVGAGPALALAYGTADLLIHYHIDWAKQYLTQGLSINDPQFWHLFGLDQMLHSLTYILFVATMLV